MAVVQDIVMTVEAKMDGAKLITTIKDPTGTEVARVVKLQNKFCDVVFDTNEKQITVHDFVDQNNLPAAYTKRKRGIAPLWLKIVDAWTEETRMRDVIEIWYANGVKYHQWCTMD